MRLIWYPFKSGSSSYFYFRFLTELQFQLENPSHPDFVCSLPCGHFFVYCTAFEIKSLLSLICNLISVSVFFFRVTISIGKSIASRFCLQSSLRSFFRLCAAFETKSLLSLIFNLISVSNFLQSYNFNWKIHRIQIQFAVFLAVMEKSRNMWKEKAVVGHVIIVERIR